MAQSMNDIKAKIVSTQSMSKITKAMQMVSAAKLTKTEAKAKGYRQYLAMLENIAENVLESPEAKSHIFFSPKQRTKCTGYLVITSDRGLAGGYNSNIFKLLQQELEGRQPDEYKVYMIGSKGFDFARRLGIAVENQYAFVPDDIKYQDIKPIVEGLIADYTNGILNEVDVLYNDCLSKIVQEPTKEQLLPLVIKQKSNHLNSVYTFEPGEDEMIDVILPKYLNATIYGKVITAKLSEHAARMNAMQNATDNALEIIKDSQFVYNRARQAAITQEINEIVGGAAALK